MKKNLKQSAIVVIMVLIVLGSTIAFGVPTGQVTKAANLATTYHGGFSAGLRSAPKQCITDIIVGVNAPDFLRKAREECESRNQRYAYCVDMCVNRAAREHKSAAKQVVLKEVPKAACNTPPKKVFDSKEACLKERLKHCAVNCKHGKEQTFCSRQALVDCVRMDRTRFSLAK
ncbi:hypothetical protein HY485_02645 [Candidatus Woesearchaeota archaeon]|nr:hypothetical protein [Candidatus Woesearchaeota archaeon]